ncbi:hypothetical protein F4680DRAFT_405595 [Xylaria scruposa]|nr:hypothetical protein F4680DRAFT_405595 [Xylaria scruposa]
MRASFLLASEMIDIFARHCKFSITPSSLLQHLSYTTIAAIPNLTPSSYIKKPIRTMSTTEEEEGGSPVYSYSDDHGRPWVGESAQSKFTVGDKVYVKASGGISREGPYLIASVTSARRYTLSSEDGKSARDGNELDEGDLESA